MAILAGIDEAGFGPMLGPLVVSGVAFQVPDDRLNTCLWDTLKTSCCRKVTSTERRLAINDSKVLYRSRGSLSPLERAALVMLAVGGTRPGTWRELLAGVAPEAIAALEEYPWYAGSDLPLPMSEGVGDVGTRANAVRRDCEDHGICFGGAYCEPVTAAAYNRVVLKTRNKSVALLGTALRVAQRILHATSDAVVRIYVDRLGGRTHYRDSLMTGFGGGDLTIVEESDRHSAYRLDLDGRRVEIAFLTDGDSRQLPVALASVYSKYLRELYMTAFNRHWSGRIDGLRPTAGYYQDAQRWLHDVGDALERYGVDRDRLVRMV